MDKCIGQCCGLCFKIDCIGACGSCCYACAQSVALAPATMCHQNGCCAQSPSKNKEYEIVTQKPPPEQEMSRVQIQF
jgi:hypothetical protein